MIRTLTAEVFIRQFHDLLDNDDCKIVWFFGAGCSVTSGIPSAGALVGKWLPQLKRRELGSDVEWQEWAVSRFEGFDPENPAKFYGRIIDELFPLPHDRQQEFEWLTSDKEPSIGYAMFSVLAAHDVHGPKCNVVLTTNFDDLIADALYLMTPKKPVVVTHDSLAGFVRPSRKRPLVVKVHGDARFALRNTVEETNKLDNALSESITPLFADCALIFVGYGGNDESIRNLLSAAPNNSFPRGIFWIGGEIPDGPVGKWLDDRAREKRDVFFILNKDFDDLFLQIKEELGLPFPDRPRFIELFEGFNRKLARDATVSVGTSSPEKAARAGRVRLTIEAVIFASRAREVANSDPTRADELYLEALKLDPNDPIILDNYAVFLMQVKKDFPRADQVFSRAIEIAPDSPGILSNFALFLGDHADDRARAEAMFERALAADPANPIALANFARFLIQENRDRNRIREMFERAINAKPEIADTFAKYAVFLSEEPETYELAREMYERAIALNPEPPILVSYATFLANTLEDFDRAAALFSRAAVAAPDDAVVLAMYALFLAQVTKDPDKAEKFYERSITLDPNQAGTLANYAELLIRTRKDFGKADEMFRRAIELDPQPEILAGYAHFQHEQMNDVTKADRLYRKAMTADPDPTFALIYTHFLAENVKDFKKADLAYQDAIGKNPDPILLSHYALFLAREMQNPTRAMDVFNETLRTHPNNPDALGCYAIFLAWSKKDPKIVEEAFRHAIESDVSNANNLTNYGAYLQQQPNGESKAREFLERAVAVDSTSVPSLINLANFLTQWTWEPIRSEELFQKALAYDPNDAFVLGNYALFLFVCGTTEEDLVRPISIAESLLVKKNVEASLRQNLCFYLLVYKASVSATIGPMIHDSLAEGVRSTGWNFTRVIDSLRSRSDSRVPFLKNLADVISEFESIDVLDDQSEWKDWAHPHS